MIHPISASYFRGLVVRCLTAARDCYDRPAKDELRKLANEFTVRANELEAPLHLSGVPKPRSAEPSRDTEDLVEQRGSETR
jgi:hypothetical protein